MEPITSTPEPITSTPTPPAPATPRTATKKPKALLISTIILAILLAGACGFILYDKLIAPSPTDANSQETTEISTTEEIKNNATSSNSATANTSLPKDFIYIPEWGIKIKKSANYHISYAYDDIATGGSISFWAAPADQQDISVSGFERPSTNPSSLGILTRDTATNYAECVKYMKSNMENEFTGSGPCIIASPPSKVAEIDGYVYLYSHPQDVSSQRKSEIDMEIKATNAIENMLRTGISAI